MIDRRQWSRITGTVEASTGFQRNTMRCDGSGTLQGAHTMVQHASGDEQSMPVDAASATVSD